MLDGAQTFGVLDVNLSVVQPDFYTGSLHKWPCGPKETGLLYVNQAVHDRIRPSVVGLYSGQVGISRTLEAHGQRDDARIAATTEALAFQGRIGRAVIERRSRQLSQALMTGLKALPGVTLWTNPDPAKSASIVVFQPGTLNVQRLGVALAEKDRIICTARGGQVMPGLRIAPHFYNTMDEIDRTVNAIRGYLQNGV
jgi:selenocysteine lyase/cysteine desulfurase